MEKLVTFFTPTYNRAHILHRCYESLCRQTSFDFDWLIVDDGSTDGTEAIVREWIANEDRFRIEYRHKENGGLHTAFNIGVEEANTELFVCFESDDIFTPDAMTIIKKVWPPLRDSDCVGFITLCKDMEGNPIGGRYPDEVKAVLYRDHRVVAPGDKQYIFRTSALKRSFRCRLFRERSFSIPNTGSLLWMRSGRLPSRTRPSIWWTISPAA